MKPSVSSKANNVFEDEVHRKHKKRKSESETLKWDPPYVEKCGRAVQFEKSALSNQNDLLNPDCSPKKRRRVHYDEAVENRRRHRTPGEDPSNVVFREGGVGKRELESDLQYEKTLRKARIWRKLLPWLREDVETDPEETRKGRETRIPRCLLTYTIAQDVGLKSAIFLKIRSFLLYILFMFFLTYSAFSNFSTETFYFTKEVSEVFIKNCIFRGVDGQVYSFESISNLNDLMGYVEGCFKVGMSKGLWGEVREHSSIVLLTTPRFRQVRVNERACLLSLFKGTVCHDFFSPFTESTATFGSGNPIGFVYQSSNDSDVWLRGFYSKYNSNGFSFLISQSDTYAYLLSQGWVDGATSAIFIDFTLYSGDANLFCVVQFLFEFPPTGRIKPSFTSRAIFLMRYHTKGGHFLLFTEIMFAFMTFTDTIGILINMIYFKCRYFLSIGMLYELATTVLCWYAVGCLIGRYFAVNTFFASRFMKEDFVDFQPVLRHHVHCDSIIVLAFFFSSFRLYGFLNFDLMGHLKITLRTCLKNIVVFSITFTIVLWAFVQVSNLLFGHSLERYRSFSRCFSELTKVMLGDLDYEGPSSILTTIGPIFILIYVIFVVFVFMNMFFAVINGTFTFVANNIDVEEESYSGFIKHCCRTVRVKCCKGQEAKYEDKKMKNSERIRNLLLDSGYSNMEIRIFFCRYIVDDAQVLDEAVFEKMWNLRIPPERLEELKILVQQLENTVDLLLSKAEWISQRIHHIKETRMLEKK